MAAVTVVTISLLSEVGEWPNRKLPQMRFDTQIRASMNQMATMVAQLNSDFIPKINAFISQIGGVSSEIASNAASALASKNAAATSATQAANSAASALSSKNAAAMSATNAANSATAANTSKNAAATSATQAATSATNAANSATNAANSATAANTSKNAAANSATNAATSATQASTSATQAANSAASALASKNASATSEANAKASELAAKAAQISASANNTQSQALLAEAKAANSDAKVILTRTQEVADRTVGFAGDAERDANSAKLWAELAHTAQKDCVAERTRIIELSADLQETFGSTLAEITGTTINALQKIDSSLASNNTLASSVSDTAAASEIAATDAEMSRLFVKLVYKAAIAERTRISELVA